MPLGALTQTSLEKYFTSAVIAADGGAAAMGTRENGARVAKKGL